MHKILLLKRDCFPYIRCLHIYFSIFIYITSILSSQLHAYKFELNTFTLNECFFSKIFIIKLIKNIHIPLGICLKFTSNCRDVFLLHHFVLTFSPIHKQRLSWKEDWMNIMAKSIDAMFGSFPISKMILTIASNS